MIRTAVLVSGGGANLQSILDEYIFGEIENLELAAVISSDPNAYALRRAEGAGVDRYVVERALFPNGASFCNALSGKLRDLDIELVVAAGFCEKLEYPLLRQYKNRIISSVPVLLPAFCGEDGLDPTRAVAETLRLGLRVSGATAYFMGERDDGVGPIILQRAVEVRQDDSVSSLTSRLMREGEWLVLPEAVRLYCQGRLSVADGRVLISPQSSPA